MIEQLRDFISGNTSVDLYANGSLERAVRLLEAWKAGIDVEQFRPEVERYIASIKVAPAIYKRSLLNPMQSSHDEFLGLLIIDALYKLGITQELIGHRGLWKTGQPHDSIKIWKWTIHVDSEWLTTYRPEYIGLARFVLGQESAIDRFMVYSNLLLSTTWNLLRARILLLEYLNVGGLDKFKQRLGDKYKGRYGDEPIMVGLWGMQDGH